MTDKEEIIEWLDTTPDKVQRNVKVVTPEDIEQSFLLHISKDTNLKKFIPVIGVRQQNGEDRTMPRVSVAPTLLGCFIGYAATALDLVSSKEQSSNEYEKFKGGFVIYSVEFKAALKPNIKLLPDTNWTDEHWLVAYSKDTSSYVPEAAGKLFYQSVRFITKSGKAPDVDVVIYIEVTRDDGVTFSKNISLKKGYWTIEGPHHYGVSSWKDDKEFKVKEISKSDYQSAKKASADLLSYVDKVPAYLNW